MSRKKTVKIIYDAIKDPIKKLFRSNVVFCEAMGFTGRDSWVSDLKRGRNLPSPEEAARMCVLLQTTPEEILSEEADIELVRGLLEQEREKGAEKERPADTFRTGRTHSAATFAANSSKSLRVTYSIAGSGFAEAGVGWACMRSTRSYVVMVGLPLASAFLTYTTGEFISQRVTALLGATIKSFAACSFGIQMID